MGHKPLFRRRHYFIKKRFQIDFSIKFLILIIIESLLAIGLFIYLSRGTVTTGFLGSEFKIARTSDFFLPTLFISNLIIIGITGIIGITVLILMSHKIAGPLYRFEKILSDIGSGDLTQRFRLRDRDQLEDLSDRITEITDTMDRKIGHVKVRADEISSVLGEIESVISAKLSKDTELERLLQQASKKILELEEALNYFKTSEHQEDKRQ